MGFGNLGIAMGAGVDEYHRGQEETRRNEEMAIRKQQAEQQATQFGWEQLDQAEKIRVRDAGQKILDEYSPHFEAVAKGDFSTAQPFLEKTYNSQANGHGDGHTVGFQQTPGGATVANFMNKDGQVVYTQPVTREATQQALQASMIAKIAAITPQGATQQFNSDREYGLAARKVGATESIAETDRQYKGVGGVMDLARADQRAISREQMALQERPAGMHEAGANSRAAVGANSLRDPKAYQAGVEEYNNYQASDEYNNAVAAGGKEAQAAIRKANSIQVKIANAAGRPIQLGLGGPKEGKADPTEDPIHAMRASVLSNNTLDPMEKMAQMKLIDDYARQVAVRTGGGYGTVPPKPAAAPAAPSGIGGTWNTATPNSRIR